MSDAAFMSAHACPKCLYDLRGIPAQSDGRIRCPECGQSWQPSRIGKVQLPAERMSRVNWMLTTYGPGLTLPLVFLAFEWLTNSVFAAFIGTLSLMAAYALCHSYFTTPNRPHRGLHVMMRAAALLVMSCMLAIVSALILGPVVMLIWVVISKGI